MDLFFEKKDPKLFGDFRKKSKIFLENLEKNSENPRKKSHTALIALCIVSRGEFCDVSLSRNTEGKTDRSL